MRSRPKLLPAAAQRGAAALLVVVVLFFILAMVTAYAGRNLIFEQRTSINGQRSAQAFEIAESGIEYAIALLGSGRVDDACQPTNDVTMPTFRQRHLSQDAGNGRFTLDAGQATRLPTCMLLAGGANCSCPAVGAPELVDPVGLAPTFQVRFETPIGITQPGVVRIVSKGCSSIAQQCYAGRANNADAVAEVSVLLGLNSALATTPIAPLTVRGSVNANGNALTVHNSDVNTRGITIDAGGPLLNGGNVRLTSSPGTPSSGSVLMSDPLLSVLDPLRMFKSVFGMDHATYRSQPASVRITCSGDCAGDIANAVASNPGRVIWLQGPVSIGSAVVLGTAAEPVMLFVEGDLTVSNNLQLHGVLYLHESTRVSGASVAWDTTGGSTVIHGAVVAENNLSVSGTPTIVYNPAVLRTINLTQGSLVRIPGSWRDFTQGS
jgi:hypothetical protein